MIKRARVVLLALFFLTSALSLLPAGEAGAIRFSKGTVLSAADASFVGEGASDHCGNSTRIVGDVNGDGYDDFLVGAPSMDANGQDSGKTYLVFGKPSGWGRGASLSNADASFIGEQPGDYSGSTVASAGDVNADGFADFLIGAQLNGENGMGAGQTYLLFGGAGPWSRNMSLSDAPASFVGEAVNDVSGISVAGAGDVNGDGYDDILIGAHGYDIGGVERGKVYVVLGKPSGWSSGMNLSAADASFTGEGEVSWFGGRVSGVGDANGDGYDDFIIGAYNDIEGGGVWYNRTGAGQVFLVFGKPSGWARNVPISTAAGASFIGEDVADYAGLSLAGAGDTNGDGYDDFLIGAPNNDDGGGNSLSFSSAGKVYLVFGKPSGWAMDTPLSGAGASFIGEHGNDALGMDLAPAGDVNGDSLGDFLVSAPFCNDGGAASGKTYLVLGATGGWSPGASIASAQASFLGEAAFDLSGISASGCGDVNRDGMDDILVSAPNGPKANPGAGVAYVIFPCINPAPDVVSIKAYSDPGCTMEIFNTSEKGKVYVELAGVDASPTSRDVALARVTTNLTSPSGIRLRLYETGNATGTFRGMIALSNRTDERDSVIAAVTGELLTITSMSDAGKNVTLLVGYDRLECLNLTVSDNNPIEGDTVRLAAEVMNDGVRPLPGVTVLFQEAPARDPGNATTFDSRQLDLPKGATVPVFADWNSTGKLGDRILKVVVDPLNIYREADELDNTATLAVNVTSPAVLSVRTDRLVYEPGEQVSILVSSSKTGENNSLEVLYPNGSALLAAAVVPGSSGNETVKAALNLSCPTGTYVVRISYRGFRANSTFVVVSEPPAISSPPDIEYMQGTAGHHINWTCGDRTPSYFCLTKNGVAVNSGPWNGSNISIPADGLPAGVYNYTLSLKDLPGNQVTDTVKVTVRANLPPVVRVLEPAADSMVSGKVKVRGTAMDPDGMLARLEFSLDNGNWTGIGAGQDWEFTWDTLNITDGKHLLTVRATDDLGAVSEDTVSLRLVGEVVSQPPSVEPPLYTEPAVVAAIPTVAVVGAGAALAATDAGRWALFKLLFLAGFTKRRDEKVLDNFIRGWVQGVVVRDPGIRPVDVVSTFEGQYSTNLIYYHINELIRHGFIYMIQRDRHGEIKLVRKGVDNRVLDFDSATQEERSTNLTLRSSMVTGMSLHLYPSDIAAPKSQISIRKKQRFMVYRYIAEHPGVTQGQLSEALDLLRQAVAYHLNELQKDDLLIIGREGKNKYYFINKEKSVDLRENVKFTEEARDESGIASGSA